MKFSLLFVLWIAMLPVSLGSFAEAAEFSLIRCAWWRMAGQVRTRDNGIVTSYELICSQDDMKPSDVEMIFISTRRAGAGETISEIYTKDVSETKGAYRVDIYSGRYEKIELLSKIRVGEQQFYTKALLFGYGESGKTDPEATRIETMPNWPSFRLVGEEYFYRPQTGIPLNVHIENGPQVMQIFVNNAHVGTETLGDTNFYTYTPPHDKTLSRAGYSAKNDLVFAVELEDGRGVVSLYIPVYRAYYGQISLKGGLGVTAASALLCLASILYSGGRFRWS